MPQSTPGQLSSALLLKASGTVTSPVHRLYTPNPRPDQQIYFSSRCEPLFSIAVTIEDRSHAIPGQAPNDRIYTDEVPGQTIHKRGR